MTAGFVHTLKGLKYCRSLGENEIKTFNLKKSNQ